MSVSKHHRRLISRRFRGNDPRRLGDDFGSIGWAIRFGKASATLIRSIRAGGYKTAREYFDFYSDKRTQHGAAIRAVNNVSKVGNPKPYYIEGRKIMALNGRASLEKGKPVYMYMR
tara:strand:+ start:1023 stop:1370 length:348 start_codon:yes stop_codon:yes gene_type:complete